MSRMFYGFGWMSDEVERMGNHPEERLVAYDEWPAILAARMEECDEPDRYLRLHTILARCIHS